MSLLHNLLNSNSSANRGYLGEQLLKAYLKRHDIPYSNSLMSDIDINGIPVEVKTATPRKQGGYLACLHKDDSHGYTNHAYADYILMQCVSKAGFIHLYLIPVEDVMHLKFLNISNHKTTKYKKYRVSYKDLSQLSTI